MPDASNGHDPASADDIDRELRELTEGSAGEPLFIEPSAAERAKALVARARHPRTSGRTQMIGSLAAIFILVFIGGLAWVRFASSAGTTGGTLPPDSGPAPVGAGLAFGGTVSPVDLFAAPPADPFAGTPADDWADGAAGIVAPSARPAGEFTAAQVAAAYGMARKLLIAANLDRQTLLGGAPTAFAKLLTAGQRAQFLAGLNKTGVTKDGYPVSTRTWVASFAPGSAQLVGSVIKVHGMMSAQAAIESGTAVLAVDVDYIFAYAVEPPHDPTDWMRVVDHEYGRIDFANWDDPGGALEPWDQATIGKAGIVCGTDDGYIHPDYPSDRSIDFRQSGPAINPYSLATTAPGGAAACGRTTGT